MKLAKLIIGCGCGEREMCQTGEWLSGAVCVCCVENSFFIKDPTPAARCGYSFAN